MFSRHYISEKNNSERLGDLRQFDCDLNFSGIDFPVKLLVIDQCDLKNSIHRFLESIFLNTREELPLPLYLIADGGFQ